MELILALAILNKAGGAYGILSILTGHGMNFWQWLYNLLAFWTLPFYISALTNLLNRASNVRKVCLGCSIYVADTTIGLLYTVYFVYFWFSREDSKPGSYGSTYNIEDDPGVVRRAAADLSQSASPQRELFLTVSGILVTSVLRIYFCFVFLSFAKQLLQQSVLNQRYHGTDSVSEEAHPTTFVGKVQLLVYKLEMRSKHFFMELFQTK